MGVAFTLNSPNLLPAPKIHPSMQSAPRYGKSMENPGSGNAGVLSADRWKSEEARSAAGIVAVKP